MKCPGRRGKVGLKKGMRAEDSVMIRIRPGSGTCARHLKALQGARS
jgi:hypothetical protein